MTLIQQLTAARRAGAPIVKVNTADAQSSVAAMLPLFEAMTGSKQYAGAPIFQWDAVRGIAALNKIALGLIEKGDVKVAETVNFTDAMLAALELPKGSVLFAHHAQRQLASQEPATCAQAVQAVANLRDAFKHDFRMLVLVGPDFPMPAEIDHDIVAIDYGMPTVDELAQITASIYESAKQKPPKDLGPYARALCGLTAFEAETAAAMVAASQPTFDQGLDVKALLQHTYAKLNATRGLSVYTGTETFADIVGQDAVKAKLRQRMQARTPLGPVVVIDEIDKVFANVESDTSGVRMDQLRTLLTEMENNEWRGLVAVGPPGGGKTLIGKALGNEAGVRTLMLDLGDTESKFVGESEAHLRHLIHVIKAIGGGHAYFIATSNAASVMRPEMQRRFTDGIWMFDLMTPAERLAAWKAYMKKYALPAQPLPEDDGWTGAEIRNCCRDAWDCSITLVEAARSIVPMARGRAEDIDRLRQLANGRMLDAANAGPYRYSKAPMVATMRAIALPGTETVN